ncbi:alpha-N-acetylglucosaminidase [Amycolatopsis sp. NPDC059021]|uniref:alpha-N-acetylglucosaminidase n=1 Tax=Amycolatopsis sp. NPDC059021 TaxID=3346704 RepID=UPI00366FE58D
MRPPRLRCLFLVAAVLVTLLSTVTTASAEPDGPPAFDTGPAARALDRLLPGRHDQIRLRAVPKDGGDAYRISGQRGRIVVEGTSPAVLLTGVHTYLREVAKADISWTGQQLNLPRRLPAPDQPILRRADVPHRFAFNDTNDGYTAPYADWAYWEREIDVLALHGINEVLVYLGQDEVYRRTFREFGYGDADVRAWVPGPAHQPWWLLQNMSGFAGPVSDQLLGRRIALARKIVGRLRELGMTPVLPGYFGTVPPKFTEHNPGARVVAQGRWGGFERPDWLDPRNEYFAKVAASFYRNQSVLYGDSAMYKMDLLHEGGNPGDVPVPEAAKAVQHALRSAHPDAIWAILGWQANPRPDILGAVDRSRMFIVDGLSDRYPTVTDREKDWLGTPYAFGSIWNFGGHTVLGANTPDWARLYPQWRDKPGSKLSGIAMMPEGADNNPAAMTLLTDLAWTPGSVDLAAWFDRYAESRYGGDDPHAKAAWSVLRETAYGTTRDDKWSEGADGLYEARPSLTTTHAAAWSPDHLRYDPAKFERALTELLQVSPSLRRSSAYRYDLVDVARQVLANRSRELLPRIKAAYDAKDRARFGELTATWLRQMDLLDQVLGTDEHFLLGRRLESARAAGASPSEKDLLEFDARSILTVWGTRNSDAEGLHDYANREWAGLVGGFYANRWRTYFAELDTALAEHRAPRPIDWFALEDQWTHGHQRYPAHPTGDAYSAASQVLAGVGTRS